MTILMATNYCHLLTVKRYLKFHFVKFMNWLNNFWLDKG